MERRHWMCYFWPGLPQLLQGSWRGLGLALLGAVFFNLALLSTFVWKEWLPEWGRSALWGGIVLLWGGSALANYPLRRKLPPPENSSHPSNALFLDAIELYLQGQWFEAERKLISLLRENPRDVEARLMIATLFRHTRRWEEALRQLDQLERLEASRAWALEIHRERERIRQAKAQAQTPTEAPISAPAEPVFAGGKEAVSKVA